MLFQGAQTNCTNPSKCGTPFVSHPSLTGNIQEQRERLQVVQAVSTSDYGCGALDGTMDKAKASSARRRRNDMEVKLG